MKKLAFLILFSAFIISGFSQSFVNYIDKINALDGNDIQQDICISSDKKFMAIGTPAAIKLVDVFNFKIIKTIPVKFDMIHLVSFLPDNNKILVVGNRSNETLAEIYSIPDKNLVKSVNPIQNGRISKGWAQGGFTFSKNYLITVYNTKKIFIHNRNTLELVRVIPFKEGKGKGMINVTISDDESLIATQTFKMFGESSLIVYSIDGKFKYTKDYDGYISGLKFTKENDLLVSEVKKEVFTNKVYKINLDTQSTIVYSGPDINTGSTLFSDTFWAFESLYEETKYQYLSPTLNILFFNDNITSTIPSSRLHYSNINPKSFNTNIRLIELPNKIILIPLGYESFNYVIDEGNKKFIGYMYSLGNKIAFISNDGRFTGDIEAINNLSYKPKGQKSSLLSAQINLFYTPKLLNQIFTYGYQEGNLADLEKAIKFAPTLTITSPDSISLQKTNQINLKYTLKDNGDGIKEIRFFINAKLMNLDVRGFKKDNSNIQEIPIQSGENIIEAVAISNNGYQSSPDRVIVNYKGVESATNLYILGIGIDKYKNTKYNLNYAVTDVSSIVDYIGNNSIGIFKNIDKKIIADIDATKVNIDIELNRIAQIAKESDVFVIYYAGHGVMNEGSSEVAKDYFMVLSDVPQMYGNDNLLAEKGLSAAELRNYCKNIKAQKQVILLDACQSGGATETFAQRGAAEEKAIVQLAQSTGVFLISSTGVEQFASEFSELKHGVFTYALLEGLKGAADGGIKDGKITIKEIESYLNDKLPELTQKYRGSMQFPNTWSKGMDFPIVTVK